MQPGRLLIIPLAAFSALLPAIAASQEETACDVLLRRLGNSPQVIGNSAEMRQYAQDLSQLNFEVRKTRIAMRRNGCGAGSVVTLGAARGDFCRDMQQDLQAMESERQAILVRREEARSLVRPTSDRLAVLAALERKGCELPGQTGRTRSGHAAIEPYSGITKTLDPSKSEAETAATKPPPPPERPYDPNRKVRTVGPEFFPENGDIDLANPASPGPQPMQ